MNRSQKFFSALLMTGLCSVAPSALLSQEPNPTAQMPSKQTQEEIKKEDNGVYLYRVNVVQRDLDAVNYLHRSGSTTIGFKGTPLLPMGRGEAKVTSERGGITSVCRRATSVNETRAAVQRVGTCKRRKSVK